MRWCSLTIRPSTGTSAYKRFVDDIFGIWIPHEDPGRSTRVEFMDLDIELQNGSVVTRVYEKPLALYQYIPPHSAHAPGNTPGLVIGQVLRFYQLCTRESDAQDQLRKFYKRLRARGHTRENLLPLFRKGLHRARTFLELPLAKRLTDSKVRSRKEDCVFFFYSPLPPQLPHALQNPTSLAIDDCRAN